MVSHTKGTKDALNFQNNLFKGYLGLQGAKSISQYGPAEVKNLIDIAKSGAAGIFDDLFGEDLEEYNRMQKENIENLRAGIDKELKAPPEGFMGNFKRRLGATGEFFKGLDKILSEGTDAPTRFPTDNKILRGIKSLHPLHGRPDDAKNEFHFHGDVYGTDQIERAIERGLQNRSVRPNSTGSGLPR